MLRQYWVKLSSLEYGKFRRLDPCTKADEMFYSCETERSVQRFISHSSSRKVVFLTACLLVVGMASQKNCELLHLWRMLTFFRRFWSELATLKSALRTLQKYSFSSIILKKTKFYSKRKCFLSLARIDLPYALLVGPSAFLKGYRLSAVLIINRVVFFSHCGLK